ncbi:LIM domain transcription factor LMO4-like isoform X1 [Anneissia japonica]|uniref:LIM domain transcription factor LMO4-like isoform X1 n=1 Tax=Anneissia japonica TaxID=1529436 RepID=UPI001425AE6C|nr:LIM domain transcription factor LMO4-like isoform X1 [Anneissia japonica]
MSNGSSTHSKLIFEPASSESKENMRPNANTANSMNPSSARFCAGCGSSIVDRFLLFAVDSYWHTGCLKCACCDAQLEDIGPSCFSKRGMILCKTDYLKLFGNSGACAACCQQIPANELVMRAQSKAYHVKCFICSTCHIPLNPGDRYTMVNGSPVCESDHSKLYKSTNMANMSKGVRAGNKVVC